MTTNTRQIRSGGWLPRLVRRCVAVWKAAIAQGDDSWGEDQGRHKPLTLPLGVTTAEENIHCIPVGNGEPLHQAHTLCWCHPAKDPESRNLYAHNAKDCREKWERQGVETAPDSLWVTVCERVSPNDQRQATASTKQ